MRKPRIDMRQLKKAKCRKNETSSLLLAIAGILALLMLLFSAGRDAKQYEDVYYDE